MEVRCPHCHAPIDLPSDTSLSDITCPSCGSSFGLLGEDETASFKGTETKTLGHFELVEPIGVGSFGCVWRARDTELDRTVAVKIPRKGQLDPDETELFLREARAAAQLRHPNIVSVHEVGREEGTVFIVSDHIDGVTLGEWLTGKKLTAREAAELCAKIADALHHAHEAGIVHRDLKPGNIMLDADGVPHIMDFGLARREAGEVTMTVEGRVLGTPAYMSPEQAKGEAHQADRRSDVYSLGVILFELLTAERPFRGSARMLLHQIIHDDAPSPRKLAATTPRDLETICQKCLEKEPAKRYQSAKELAEDFRRFLAGEPIKAQTVTLLYRGWRWCKRKPVVAGLSAALLSLLLIIVIVAPFVAWREAQLRQKADDLATDRRRSLYSADMNVARQAWEESNVGRVLQILGQHLPEPEETDLRRFEWYYLWRLCKPTLEAKRIEVPYKAHRVTFAPDGKTLAVGYGHGRVGLFNLTTREPRQTIGKDRTEFYPFVAYSPDGTMLALPSSDDTEIVVRHLETGTDRLLTGHEGTVHDVAFSRDSRFLASASEDETLRIWDLTTDGTPKAMPRHGSGVWSVAFSPDDHTLASGTDAGVIKLWKWRTGKELASIVGSSFPSPSNNMHRIWSLAFSSDGRVLAAGCGDWCIRIIDPVTGRVERTLTGHHDEVRCVAISHDDRTLASASRDSTVKLWDLRTYKDRGTLKGVSFGGHACAFSPQDAVLASGGVDYRVLLWDLTAKRELDVFQMETDHRRFRVDKSMVFSQNGETVASLVSGANGVVKVYRTGDGKEEPSVRTGETVRSLAVSDSNVMAIGGEGLIRLQDLRTNKELGSIRLRTTVIVTALGFSRDGRKLAAGGSDGSISIYTVEGGNNSRSLASGHKGPVSCVVFSKDGCLLASGDSKGGIVVCDAETADVIREFTGHRDRVLCAAFSPDGKLLATGALEHERALCLWDLTGTTEDPQVLMSARSVYSLLFSPDGATLFAAHGDNTVRLWDPVTGQQRLAISGHTCAVQSLALSFDGNTLRSLDRYGTVRVWKAASRKEVETADPLWMKAHLPELKE